jgi:hypothetical protein
MLRANADDANTTSASTTSASTTSTMASSLRLPTCSTGTQVTTTTSLHGERPLNRRSDEHDHNCNDATATAPPSPLARFFRHLSPRRSASICHHCHPSCHLRTQGRRKEVHDPSVKAERRHVARRNCGRPRCHVAGSADPTDVTHVLSQTQPAPSHQATRKIAHRKSRRRNRAWGLTPDVEAAHGDLEVNLERKVA